MKEEDGKEEAREGKGMRERSRGERVAEGGSGREEEGRPAERAMGWEGEIGR